MQGCCTTASAGPARQAPTAWQSSLHTRVLKCWSRPITALQVERWDVQKHGKLSTKTMLKRLRDEGYSGSTYQFPPGTQFPFHAHNCDKKDSIITGSFKFVSKDQGEDVIKQGVFMTRGPVGARMTTSARVCMYRLIASTVWSFDAVHGCAAVEALMSGLET